MKLGVTFSGSGALAARSNELVEALSDSSLRIGMLSATSLSAVPALLWSRGLEAAETGELMDLLLGAQSPALGLRQLEGMGVLRAKAPRYDLAVCSVDCATGVTVIFCDSLRSDAWNLKIYPLTGNEREALTAAICPYGGLEPQKWEEMQLCDFAARYGCPFFPLWLAGMERTLAVSFAGGDAPAQIAADSLSALTARNADRCLVLGGGEDPGRAVEALLPALRALCDG